MPAYRDESASLEERHHTLRQALSANRARSEVLAKEEADLHKELAVLHTNLAAEQQQQQQGAQRVPRRRLPMARVLVASPCDVPWSSMVGNDRVRHCAACAKDVHNLSSMTEAEVQAFFDVATTNAVVSGIPLPCVAFYERTDGTILTQDCPVGVRRRRLRNLLATAMGLGAAAVIGFTSLAVFSYLKTGQVSLEGMNPFGSFSPPVVTCPTRPTSTGVFTSATGYVQFNGDAGNRVYENGVYLGTSSFSINATPGTHVYRIESVNGRQSRTITTVVKEHDIAHVYVTFQPLNPTGGGAMMAGAPVALPGRMTK